MSPSTPAVSGRTPTPPFVAAQQPHGGGRNGAGTRASVLGSGWIRALATIGPALLVLLVAAFAFRAIDDTAARREQVVRSYRVELALEQLVERLRHAESAHRGYLLTGQAAYRARTEGALADLWAVHRQLGGLVSDDAQHRRLAALVPAVQARVAFMDSAVRVYDARGEEAAEALIASGRGQVLGDVVRRQVMAMHGAQETLLAARRDAERAADRRTLVVLGAGLGLAALLATLTNVLFVRHARSLAERTAAAEAGERWLRTTLESIGEGFLLLDRQWRVAYANPQVHAMLRLEAGLTGQSVWDALPASLGREHRSAYERAASAGEAIAFAAHFAPLERWFDVRAYPTPDGLAVYVDDVTESRRAESALRESEARLAGVIGSAMDTIITTDSAQRIVLFNAAAERAFGVSAHEAIGAPLDRFIPSRYRGRHHAHVEEYGATGVTTRAMGRALATSAAGLPASGASAPGAAHGPGAVLALRADGTEFPIEAAISQVETRGGRFFTVILRDVTERLRAEAALRATEEWLRFLAAASNALAGSATTAISFDEVARLAVPLLADACAIDVIDATGRSDRVAAHAVDGMGTLATGVLDAAVAGALREGRPQCLAAVDDAWRAVAPGAASLLLVPLVAEAAALDEARAAGTERGRGEGAAPVPAGEARREGVPHPGVPPAGAPQAGAPQADAPRADAPRADAPQADAPDEPAARDAPSSGAARVLGLLALARTARRAPFADEDVERGTELARRVTVALERLRLHREALAGRAAAEHANRAKSQFMATMSHELRTPLNAITGYTELMELGVAGPTSEQQLAYLGRVRASAKHLLGLINEVLDLAKVEAGRVTVARAPLDVGAATEEALTLVRPQAAARRLTLDTAACTGAMAAVGDAGRVRQILVNLLSNAVKFTEPNGRITLTCGVRAEPVAGVPLPGRGPWAYVRVTDTGIGIPGDKLESVFEPFVQVDGAYTRQHGGTGLGLAISRRLARLMHGDLTLESRVGQGSTFTLWLPTVPLYRVAGRLTPASGLRVVSRTVPARSADIRELLHASVPLVLRRFVERLRADPLTAESRGAPDVEVEHHVAAFVAQLGQEIAILDARDADRSALIRDGSAIQAVIMQRRAAQRRRLGWTEAAVRREYTILGEELEAALRLGSAPAGQGPGGAGDPALEDAVALVRAFVQEACRAGVRAFRDAEPAPDADARSGEAAVPGERGSGAGETPSVPAHAPAEGSR